MENKRGHSIIHFSVVFSDGSFICWGLNVSVLLAFGTNRRENCLNIFPKIENENEIKEKLFFFIYIKEK